MTTSADVRHVPRSSRSAGNCLPRCRCLVGTCLQRGGLALACLGHPLSLNTGRLPVGSMDRRLLDQLEMTLRNLETWIAVGLVDDEPPSVRAARIAAVTEVQFRSAEPTDYQALDGRLGRSNNRYACPRATGGVSMGERVIATLASCSPSPCAGSTSRTARRCTSTTDLWPACAARALAARW